ncbi:MAG: hypothetical protein HC912_04955 [Saprospiraceae bacterium]|nr:hypothetical protein [Saprospiraceae bacterium]
MNAKQFILSLLLLTVAVICLVYSFGYLDALSSYLDLGLMSIALFSTICAGMYFFASRSAKKDQKVAFLNIFMLSTLLKMLFSVILIALYYKTQVPTTKFFILPFFVVYAIYTIFEVWFMSKLTKIYSK